MKLDELLFPHDKPREEQLPFLLKVHDIVNRGENLIVHAPTGLGKTAAVLSPCLKYALENNKTIFFLTSRHTQHNIVLETLGKIREKYRKNFSAISIVGKKNLCLQQGIESFSSQDLNEYCKSLRDSLSCEFHQNIGSKDSISVGASRALSELQAKSHIAADDSMNVCRNYNVCPYEISAMIAKDAKVIIGDYYYMFHPDIRTFFLKKINKTLEDSIIIVDEAHNLPGRVKDLFTARLSSTMLKRAIEEAEKFKHETLAEAMSSLSELLDRMSNFNGEERYLAKNDFVSEVDAIFGYDDLVAELETVADSVRMKQRQSYLGSVASFLGAWVGSDDGFARIFSKNRTSHGTTKVISYRCLDPSLASRDVIKAAYSTIIMSGTLLPTSMYNAVLGFDHAEEKSYKSPFPEQNQLNLIIPKTSTKYELRNKEQFMEIAGIVARIVNSVQGNSAVFFPSYDLRDSVYKNLKWQCQKPLLLEHSFMSEAEKQQLLDEFKRGKDTGSALLAAISGSFAEGIDLPGDYLNGVVIVGLPLTKPDLESKALISYYDKKFGKGRDYGYLFPAFNKALQCAGRCIRSETDRGVVVFLDERYTKPYYKRCFPQSWKLNTTLDYELMIKRFFQK